MPVRTATQLAQDHLKFLATDFAEWGKLLADDMAWEFPFSPEGQANRYTGREAISKLVSGFLGSVRDLHFSPPRIHRIADDDAVFAEFSGECIVVATGKTYRNDYAFYLQGVDGKIVLIREYINPLNSMKAFS